MIVIFEQDYLKELFQKGKADKKHRFQPEIVRGFQKCIKMMIHATDISKIAQIRSLNYEVLKGDKKGISSVRINRQYRIEFKVTIVDANPVVTICAILEISNHYE